MSLLEWVRLASLSLNPASYSVAIIAGAILVLANVPGNRDWRGTECSYGWPMCYLNRTDRFAEEVSIWPWVHQTYSFDPKVNSLLHDKLVTHFSATALAVDISLALAIIVTLTVSFELWKRARRQIFQFRVAELLVLVTICAGFFGWSRSVLQRHGEQEEAIAAIRNLGGQVIVEPGGPDWLHVLIGEYGHFKTFDRPVCVKIGDAENACGTFIDAVIERNSKIGDADIVQLSKLVTVKEIDLSFTQISDSGLSSLESLNGLEELSLACTPISDAGLIRLTRLRTLRKLDLRDTRVTNEGMDVIRKVLPNCTLMPPHRANQTRNNLSPVSN